MYLSGFTQLDGNEFSLVFTQDPDHYYYNYDDVIIVYKAHERDGQYYVLVNF